MPRSSETSYPYEKEPKPPLWLQLVLLATRFLVRGYSDIRRANENLGRKPFRHMAFHRFLADQYTQPTEELISIICAACHANIGTLESEEHIEDADAIAIAHSSHCPASEAEKEQALYDVQFRDMTSQLDL